MNKVFEQIIEKLEEIRAKKTCNKEKCDTKEICRICVVDDAIEIVKQEAEKYNNGWILVSEKLPEDYETYLVTNVESFGQRHTYKGWYGVEHKIWHMEGNSERKMNVVAWQPLPQPYQQKGE